MKYIVVLVALAVVCSVNCLSSEKDLFKKLSKSDFGQTIIQTIQLELGGGSENLDTIVDLLKEMKNEAEQENSDSKSKSDSLASSCSARVEEIDEVITKSSEQLADDQRKIPLNEEELDDKQTQAADKNDEEQRNLDKIAFLTQERAEVRSSYEERRDELLNQIITLQDAKNIISQLQGDSFLQSTSETVFAQFKAHHQKFKSLFPQQRGFNGLISLLLETTQDPNVADQVDTIVEVINDLIESLYDVQNTEMQTEDSRKGDFVLQITRIQTLNDNMAESIASLNAVVQVLLQKNLEFTNDINSLQNILDNKGLERLHWTKSCKDEQDGSDKQQKQRSEEIEILDQVLSIFENGLSEEVRNYVSQIQIDA